MDSNLSSKTTGHFVSLSVPQFSHLLSGGTTIIKEMGSMLLVILILGLFVL